MANGFTSIGISLNSVLAENCCTANIFTTAIATRLIIPMITFNYLPTRSIRFITTLNVVKSLLANPLQALQRLVDLDGALRVLERFHEIVLVHVRDLLRAECRPIGVAVIENRRA